MQWGLELTRAQTTTMLEFVGIKAKSEMNKAGMPQQREQ